MIRLTIRVYLLTVLFASLVICVGSLSWAALPSYIGSLSTETLPTGILGTGFWTTTGPVQIEWSVSQLESGVWDYSYLLDVPGGNISHFILECSPSFTASDIISSSGDFTSITVGTFTPPDPSNPNLPGSIYGMKFNEVSTTSAIFSFHTNRAPVWGNFYTKDGNAFNPVGVTNTAWNTGFNNPTPTDPPSDGSIDNHILVPDTASVVPDASTIILACFGAVQLFAVRKKIFR